MKFVLLEPTRPPGFVSGGYRYQDEIMRRLTKRGHDQCAVPAEHFDAAVANTRRAGWTPVVDGLFIERTGRPLPENVIALLHMTPSLPRWCEAPIAVIVTGESTRAAIAAASRSVQVVRPGLDACFSPPPTPHHNPRRRVLCVGTLSPAKGQHLVASAASRASAAGHVIELVCVGDRTAADYVDEIRQAAGDVPVEMPGCLAPADVADQMQRADVFVSASRSESFGMAAAEAAACGLPMVAFDTGAIASFATAGDRVIPAATPNAELVDILSQVFSERPTPRTSSRAALDNWDTVADRFESAVDAAVRESDSQ